MRLGTAILIIFAVQAFLWPVELWLTIFQRLAFVAAVIAAIWFVWLKPQQDAEEIAFWKANIAELEPKCEAQKAQNRKSDAFGWDVCKSLQQNRDALAHGP